MLSGGRKVGRSVSRRGKRAARLCRHAHGLSRHLVGSRAHGSQRSASRRATSGPRERRRTLMIALPASLTYASGSGSEKEELTKITSPEVVLLMPAAGRQAGPVGRSALRPVARSCQRPESSERRRGAASTSRAQRPRPLARHLGRPIPAPGTLLWSAFKPQRAAAPSRREICSTRQDVLVVAGEEVGATGGGDVSPQQQHQQRLELQPRPKETHS